MGPNLFSPLNVIRRSLVYFTIWSSLHNIHWSFILSLREKCPYSELFWSALSRIQFKCGKMRTRITPNTFHAVCVCVCVCVCVRARLYYVPWASLFKLLPKNAFWFAFALEISYYYLLKCIIRKCKQGVIIKSGDWIFYI